MARIKYKDYKLSKIATKNRKPNVAKKQRFSTNPSQELKKVTWPNRNTLVKSTILILVICFLLTSYVAGLDFIFAELLQTLRRISGTI